MATGWRRAAVLGAGVILLVGCVEEESGSPWPDYETRTWSLDAFCTANVRGVGNRDVETDYLAHVISCENGAADFEALKAQTVAARTYLYFKLETSGDIGDGTGDQVYTCNRPPNETHIEAVRQTAGEVVRHNGITLAAFYVAGSIPTTNDCVPGPGDRDPTSTERFVTYNQGRSGGDVETTSLGHPANPRNRGCKSQNGAHCLAEKGWQHQDILRFYYGEDVVFEVAEGACVMPDPDPDPQPAPQPDPEPTPEPDAQPDPQPAPQPDPQPTPEPMPEPDPQPDGQPAPQPDPNPGFQPDPQPSPQPDGQAQNPDTIPEGVRITEFREGCSINAVPAAPSIPWALMLLGLVAMRRRFER